MHEVKILATDVVAAAEDLRRTYEEAEIELRFEDHSETTFEYKGSDANEGFEIENFECMCG